MISSRRLLVRSSSFRDFLLMIFLTSWRLAAQRAGHTYAATEQGVPHPSRVVLMSSDSALVNGFAWAKAQALKYVVPGAPVGAAYMSVVPGEGRPGYFCAREVAHAGVGAQVLGLAAHTKHMLHAFASHISSGREWMTFMCLSREGRPVPDVYTDDRHFRYDLPANFDLLQASYHQFLWTGDPAYLEDPVFLHFYARTVSSYVRQWDLDGDGIMESVAENGDRGYPSYVHDPDRRPLTGGDLVAAQYAGYKAYARIEALRGARREAERYETKANYLSSLYSSDWWDVKHWRYYAYRRQDHRMDSTDVAAEHVLPYWFGQVPLTGINTRSELGDGHVADADTAIQSYVPWVLYTHGWNGAYEALIKLMRSRPRDQGKSELAFSIVDNVVEGVMGLSPDASQRLVETLSHVQDPSGWVTLKNVPLFGNEITVTHRGITETQVTNKAGPTIRWKARFLISGTRGDPDYCGGELFAVDCIPKYLLVDGVPRRATRDLTPADGDTRREVWVMVSVRPGETHTVRVVPLKKQKGSAPPSDLPARGDDSFASTTATDPTRIGRIVFESSDSALVKGFDWAKTQALTFVYSHTPVGEVYGTETNRRYCANWVGTDRAGAQLLGLASHTKNLLRTFAKYTTASRKWITYQCMDVDKPGLPDDNLDDKNTGWDMPMHFDVILGAYRQYLWTGDSTYLNDPLLLGYYKHVVDDYVRSWDTDGDGILDSPRASGYYGIGSNYEDLSLPVATGADLLAGQYAGYVTYARILALKGNRTAARIYEAKGRRLKQVYNTVWWDPVLQRHHSAQLQDRSMTSAYFDSDYLVPFWFEQIPEEGTKTEHDLDYIEKTGAQYAENGSFLPWIFYKYGRNEAAYAALLTQVAPDYPLRDYPMFAFTTLSHVAEGLMGLAPDASRGWVETLPRLTSHTAWATLRNIPVFRNEISVTHTGTTHTQFTNQSGPAILWKADFPVRAVHGRPHDCDGETIVTACAQPYLVVDGTVVRARTEIGINGQVRRFVLVPVEPGETHVVRLP